MADEKEFVLTREGKLELENELDTLKNVTRKEVSEKIKLCCVAFSYLGD